MNEAARRTEPQYLNAKKKTIKTMSSSSFKEKVKLMAHFTMYFLIFILKG